MIHREFVARLDDYLAARISTAEIAEWLVKNLQRLLDSGDEETIQLANDIDADLIALSDRLVSESELRARVKTRRHGQLVLVGQDAMLPRPSPSVTITTANDVRIGSDGRPNSIVNAEIALV